MSDPEGIKINASILSISLRDEDDATTPSISSATTPLEPEQDEQSVATSTLLKEDQSQTEFKGDVQDGDELLSEAISVHSSPTSLPDAESWEKCGSSSVESGAPGTNGSVISNASSSSSTTIAPSISPEQIVSSSGSEDEEGSMQVISSDSSTLISTIATSTSPEKCVASPDFKEEEVSLHSDTSSNVSELIAEADTVTTGATGATNADADREETTTCEPESIYDEEPPLSTGTEEPQSKEGLPDLMVKAENEWGEYESAQEDAEVANSQQEGTNEINSAIEQCEDAPVETAQSGPIDPLTTEGAASETIDDSMPSVSPGNPIIDEKLEEALLKELDFPVATDSPALAEISTTLARDKEKRTKKSQSTTTTEAVVDPEVGFGGRLQDDESDVHYDVTDSCANPSEVLAESLVAMSPEMEKKAEEGEGGMKMAVVNDPRVDCCWRLQDDESDTSHHASCSGPPEALAESSATLAPDEEKMTKEDISTKMVAVEDSGLDCGQSLPGDESDASHDASCIIPSQSPAGNSASLAPQEEKKMPLEAKSTIGMAAAETSSADCGRRLKDDKSDVRHDDICSTIPRKALAASLARGEEKMTLKGRSATRLETAEDPRVDCGGRLQDNNKTDSSQPAICTIPSKALAKSSATLAPDEGNITEEGKITTKTAAVDPPVDCGRRLQDDESDIRHDARCTTPNPATLAPDEELKAMDGQSTTTVAAAEDPPNNFGFDARYTSPPKTENTATLAPEEEKTTEEGPSTTETLASENPVVVHAQRLKDDESDLDHDAKGSSYPNAASQLAADRVRSYATFRPIGQEESNVSDQDDATMVTAQDMPHLEDISVDSSHESRSFCSTDDAPKVDEVLTDKNLGMHVADRGHVEESEALESPQSASATTSSAFSVASSDSFKQQKEPDGDCEFLNQTLNISAIDTSAMFSESCATGDLPSLAMSVPEDNRRDTIEESYVGDGDDAPGDVMTNESKITTDLSLVLPRAPKMDGASELQQQGEAAVVQEESPADVNVMIPGSRDDGRRLRHLRFTGDRGNNESFTSLTSFISTEQSREGIELVSTRNSQEKPDSRKGSFSVNEQPHRDSPLVSLSKETYGAISSPGQETSRKLSPLLLRTNSDDAPIARIRSSREEALLENPAGDPVGTLVDKQQDLALLGGLKKSSGSRVEDKPKPRVSFAAMHKGPHYERHPRCGSPRRFVDDDCHGEEEHDSRTSIDKARRARFAAYLKRRMIDYDEENGCEEQDDVSFVQDGEDDDSLAHQQCHGGIPRILDPSIMCTSVESSFTTLVSKGEPADEGEAIFTAIDMFMGRKSKYSDDTDSDSSYCTDSDEDSYEDDDIKSTTFFPSLFTDGASERDAPKTESNQIPNWCKEIGLPSVLQLEDVLKAATDFGRANNKKVSHQPHNPDHEVSEFVDELEKEEPLQHATSCPEEKKSATVAVSLPKPNNSPRPIPKAAQHKQSPSNEAPSECGVLTLQDIQELAQMAAAAIETTTKKVQRRQTLKLKSRESDDLDRSTDSTEAAWDRVEHTVNDHESVTGQSFQEKSTAQDRIAAKLDYIKKTQPQVYKVFLAKMAAAEKAGKKFELHRDDVIVQVLPEEERDCSDKNGSSSATATAGEEASLVRNEKASKAEAMPVQTPNMSIKIHVKTEATKAEISSSPPSDWVPFDGTPFKEPATAMSFLSADAVTDRRDDSSVFDDMKWLNSAKDSFSSTIESFIDAPKKMARPLKAKLAQYSKTHPNFYRILLNKINEREQEVSNKSPAPEVQGNLQRGNSAAKSTVSSNQMYNLDDDINFDDGSQVEVTEKEFMCRQQEKGKRLAVPNKVPKKLMFQKTSMNSNDSSPATVEFDSRKKPEKDVRFATNPDSNETGKPQTQSLHFSSQFIEAAGRATKAPKTPVEGAGESNRREQQYQTSNHHEAREQGMEQQRTMGETNRKGILRKDDGSTDPIPCFESRRKDFASSPGNSNKPRNRLMKSRESEGNNQESSRKLAFFAKKTSLRQSEPPPAKTNVNGGNSQFFTTKDCLFNRLEEKEHHRSLTSGETLASQHSTCSQGANVVSDTDGGAAQHKISFAERSKTPVLSNRTGRSQHGVQQHTCELSKTPRSSNRSEVKHTRPSVIHDAMPLKAKRSNAVDGATLASRQDASIGVDSPAGDQPHPSTANSSQWESFEGSTFKDFVLQTVKGPTSEDAKSKATPSGKMPGSAFTAGTKANSPQISLKATFLDSILPAPPSFPAQSEFHNQQRDPWDFSEAAGEQWEHFSPLSFDSNFTNWGAKPSRGRQQAQRRTRTSPSSVSEF